jgi:hypothetical protein
MAKRKKAKRKKKVSNAGKRYPEHVRAKAKQLAKTMSKSKVAKVLKVPLSAVAYWTKGTTSQNAPVASKNRWGIVSRISNEIRALERKLNGKKRIEDQIAAKKVRIVELLERS